jgi:RNA polymerase-binding transcription factor DksA
MTPPDASHLRDPEQLQRWRRQVLDKGREIASALEKVMNGLDVRLEMLGGGFDPGVARTKRDRLRKFLDQIDRVVKSFPAGTFGHCAECRAVIDESRLLESPWTERCAACFAKAVHEGTL